MRVLAAVLVAGAASGVLFGTTLQGTVLLAYFAQLPLFIVGLSHGWTAAAAAGIAGSASAMAVGGFGLAAAFAVMEAVPVVLLCWRALRHRARPDGSIEWYGSGGLATEATLATAIVAAVQTVMMVQLAGGPDAVMSRIEPMIGAMGGSIDESMRAFIGAIIRILPGIAAASWFWMLVVNGALGQWIAKRSGSAWRPSPQMAELEMPRWVSELFAICAIGSLFPGFAGLLGENLVVALLGAFALAGFAIVHAAAAKVGNRLMLAATYLVVVVFGFPLLLLAIAGALEPWLRLRARFLSGAAPRA